MNFTKMQAIGNDFVVIEEPENTELSVLAAKVCERHFGIGADGLLTYRATETGLNFRIFNADGSEDTMCGNGLRCVVRLAVERGQSPGIGIAQTASGEVPYALNKGDVTLTLPPPRFWKQSIAQATTVDTGSLHTVVWQIGSPNDEDFLRTSPVIENDPLFPKKTSVMWSFVDQENQLRIRIWERGVGETLGCGTGACAAAVVAIHQGRASSARPVAVTSKGGTVHVQWDGDERSPIFLVGSASTIYRGSLASFIQGR